MNIVFFGTSLVSAYWNPTASYFRGMAHALRERGHDITFFEPDARQRQQYRDIANPAWARVVVFRPEKSAVEAAVESARDADLIVKISRIGVFDELLEAGLVALKTSDNHVVFWDVDAAATLVRIAGDPADPFIPLIPRYDAILTSGGGEHLIGAYKQWGAPECAPVYGALDPSAHFASERDPRYSGDVAFLGDRLPDREARVDEFLIKPALALPDSRFLLAGSGWDGRSLPSNVRYVGHVFAGDHNAFNSTPRAVLNITRECDAESGYSPATSIFEAAGAGACVITDAWEGIEQFFEPGEEVLVANSGDEVVELVRSLTWSQAEKVGQAARQRALWQHTYAQRVQCVEAVFGGVRPKQIFA